VTIRISADRILSRLAGMQLQDVEKHEDAIRRYSRPISDETRRKISESKKGSVRSSTTKRRISDRMKIVQQEQGNAKR